MSSDNAAYPGASASHTSTAAETSYTEETATLTGGAVGKPVRIMCSGSVGGLVMLRYGSGLQKIVAVAPNQLPVELKIPRGAFPNNVSSVTLNFQCTGGVGTLVGIVDFAPA